MLHHHSAFNPSSCSIQYLSSPSSWHSSPEHISNFINPPKGNAFNVICLYSRESVLLMERPCMLDDGLDPPIWTQAHYHQPNWVPWELKQEQSPSLFSGQDSECSFCRFIMGSHRRSPQCVKNLWETDEAGIFFILITLHEIWHCGVIMFL